MKKLIALIIFSIILSLGFSCSYSTAEASGWETAGKVLASAAAADLVFNRGDSMVGRTVKGVGNIFTGGDSHSKPSTTYQPTYRQASFSDFHQQPSNHIQSHNQPVQYGNDHSYQPSQPRSWQETRSIPAYDQNGNFLGYINKKVTVYME